MPAQTLLPPARDCAAHNIRRALQTESPQQANACDCGFFTVLNAEHVLGWLADVLAPAPDGSPEPFSQAPGDDCPPLEKAPFHKGDVGAFRSVAFQALSEEWMTQASIAEGHKMRARERTERQDIPQVVLDRGCRWVYKYRIRD